MLRQKFDAEKSRIIQNLIELCQVSMTQLEKAIQAAKTKDKSLSDEVWRINEETRLTEAQIDQLSAFFLAMESPIGHDLREIIMVIKSIDSFERINRHACSLATIPLELDAQIYETIMPSFEAMVRNELKMLQATLDAFTKDSLVGLSLISDLDDVVDDLYRNLKQKIYDKMKTDERLVEAGVSALSLARYLERVGDHITDIAEWVYYGHKGTHTQLNK